MALHTSGGSNISFGAWWATQWDEHVYHVKSQGTQNYEAHNILLNLLWGSQTFVHQEA